MKTLRLWLLLALLAHGAFAQWVNFPAPGMPRTRDGKVNLSAPALFGDADVSPPRWTIVPKQIDAVDPGFQGSGGKTERVPCRLVS